MNTYDEETRSFFKHSSVRVLLCPRSGGKGHSWLKQQVSFKNYFCMSNDCIIWFEENVYKSVNFWFYISCIHLL